MNVPFLHWTKHLSRFTHKAVILSKLPAPIMLMEPLILKGELLAGNLQRRVVIWGLITDMDGDDIYKNKEKKISRVARTYKS